MTPKRTRTSTSYRRRATQRRRPIKAILWKADDVDRSKTEGGDVSRRRRISWSSVLEEASRIVSSFETGVTLRQLFYRLVAAEILPNTIGAYKTLSARTAEARRVGEFPNLIDRGRASIVRSRSRRRPRLESGSEIAIGATEPDRNGRSTSASKKPG